MKQLLFFFFLIHLFACLQFAASDAKGFAPSCATEARHDESGAVVGRSCWIYRAALLPLNVTSFGSSADVDTSRLGYNYRPPSGGELYMAAFFHTGLQMLNGEVRWRRHSNHH